MHNERFHYLYLPESPEKQAENPPKTMANCKICPAHTSNISHTTGGTDPSSHPSTAPLPNTPGCMLAAGDLAPPTPTKEGGGIDELAQGRRKPKVTLRS